MIDSIGTREAIRLMQRASKVVRILCFQKNRMKMRGEPCFRFVMHLPGRVQKKSLARKLMGLTWRPSAFRALMSLIAIGLSFYGRKVKGLRCGLYQSR